MGPRPGPLEDLVRRDHPARFEGKGRGVRARRVFKTPGRDSGGAGVHAGQLLGGGPRKIKDR
jgi:hypothetical protein